jgi:hypothetical protein
MAAPGDAWDELHERIDRLWTAVRGVNAVAVNSASLKAEVKDAVQYYFRSARPWVISVGMKETDLQNIDGAFQDINALALGNNRRKSYLNSLKTCRTEIAAIGMQRHMLIGRSTITPAARITLPQQKVIETLSAMLPSASRSFAQVLNDLADPSRVSFRGPAAELREILRELIDHLAPDSVVVSATGFQFEKGRNSPTVRQKVRFIMKSRGKSSNASATAEDALAASEALARSLYTRGSAATHTAQERKEVLGIQRYTEAVLIDLLEIE